MLADIFSMNCREILSLLPSNQNITLEVARKKKSIRHEKAIIVIARKITTIIWHLIINYKYTKIKQEI